MPSGLTKNKLLKLLATANLCGTAIHFVSDGIISKSEANNEIVSKKLIQKKKKR